MNQTLEPVGNGTYLMRGLMAWTFLPAVALFNGIIATSILLPALGQTRAAYVSALTLLILVVVFIAIVGPRMGRPANIRVALVVGLLWVALNVVWQFLFFGGVMGVPAREIAKGFDFGTVLQGNLYPLIQLVVAFGPWAFLAWGSQPKT
jgi:hypothetical protein